MSRPWLLLLLGTEPQGSRGFGLRSKPATPARFDSGCGVVAILHTAHGRLSERPMEADCKSVAKATKVRILHLPPSADRPPAEHELSTGADLFLSGCARRDPADGGCPRPMRRRWRGATKAPHGTRTAPC